MGAFAVAPHASAETAGCAEGRCSTAAAALTLEGKEALRTSIDTGWMPSCGNGQEHCNKGLQVRADIALTALTKDANLFTAAMPKSAVVKASWENLGKLELSTASLGGADSTLTIAHSLTPQVELYIDIGPVEQGFAFSATKLLQKIPGSKFEYASSATMNFPGWGFEGASLTVPAPALQTSQLFSVDLASFPDVIDKVVTGSLALHARTSPTFTFKTTKVNVAGRDLSPNAVSQIEFPRGDFDYLEFPATIEAELSAKGEIEVIPSATLARIGDLNFSPPTTITFSSVKVAKSYNAPPQKYVFTDKKIRIPLPNVREPRQGLSADVEVGSDGVIPALMENRGEAPALVRLESSDPRFEVPSGSVTLTPKAKSPLNITFHAEALGEAEATITAYTNDPDTPELTFTVSARGVDGPVDGPGGKKKGGGPDDDGILGPEGCGCKTAGTRTTTTGYAGLGLAALGLAAMIRRRRR
jgi:MYXO-CTERM domain-containing protein